MGILKKKPVIDTDHIDFVDNSPEAIEARKLQEAANNHAEQQELKALEQAANSTHQAIEDQKLNQAANNSYDAVNDRQMQAAADKFTLPPKKEPKKTVAQKVKGFFNKLWKK